MIDPDDLKLMREKAAILKHCLDSYSDERQYEVGCALLFCRDLLPMLEQAFRDRVNQKQREAQED